LLISIDWTPDKTGNYTVYAWGADINSSTSIVVFDDDFKPINVTSELTTIVLTSAGLIGVLGLARMKRKE